MAANAETEDAMGTETASKPNQEAHQALATWAIACAARVLVHFEAARPTDVRVRQALEASRAWVRGELPMTQVRRFAFAVTPAA